MFSIHAAGETRPETAPSNYRKDSYGDEVMGGEGRFVVPEVPAGGSLKIIPDIVLRRKANNLPQNRAEFIRKALGRARLPLPRPNRKKNPPLTTPKRDPSCHRQTESPRENGASRRWIIARYGSMEGEQTGEAWSSEEEKEE